MGSIGVCGMTYSSQNYVAAENAECYENRRFFQSVESEAFSQVSLGDEYREYMTSDFREIYTSKMNVKALMSDVAMFKRHSNDFQHFFEILRRIVEQLW